MEFGELLVGCRVYVGRRSLIVGLAALALSGAKHLVTGKGQRESEERFLTSAGRPVAGATGGKKSACSVRNDSGAVGRAVMSELKLRPPEERRKADPSASVGMTEKKKAGGR